MKQKQIQNTDPYWIKMPPQPRGGSKYKEEDAKPEDLNEELLNKLSLSQLKILAKQLGLKNISKTRKRLLIRVILETKQGGSILSFFNSVGKRVKKVMNNNVVKSVAKTVAKAPLVRNVVSLFDFRKGFTKGAKATLSKVGDMGVVSITMFRCPISSIIKGAINVLSFGKFNELLKKHGFDKLFHLGMILTLRDGRQIVIEKNDEINVSFKLPKIKSGCDTMAVPIGGRIATFSPIELLLNTKKAVGDKLFYDYDGTRNNCQNFMINILARNKLLTPALKDFIYQDLNELFEDMDERASYMRGLMKATTRMGKVANVLTGQGEAPYIYDYY